MAVQIGLLTKAAVTQVALKGLLLVMNVTDVSLEVGGDAEGTVTVFTSAQREEEKKGLSEVPVQICKQQITSQMMSQCKHGWHITRYRAH